MKGFTCILFIAVCIWVAIVPAAEAEQAKVT